MTNHPSYIDPLVYDMEIRDLNPSKDPKGGSPKSGAINLPPVEQPKKPKSDQIRSATMGDYLSAQSHAHFGFKTFLTSNLFAALVIFLLGQAVLLGLSYLATYNQTSTLVEWKIGTVDPTLKRMDEWGTNHSHYADERQDAAIVELKARTAALADSANTMSGFANLQGARNNQQDQRIATIETQLSAIVPTLAEIRAKMNFIAELLDERTKNKK